MNRRRVLALLVAGSLAGCASQTDSGTGGSQTPDTASETEAPPDIEPTPTSAPIPSVVAERSEDAPDRWRTSGHDPNGSRFNRGGELPSEKPAFKRELSPVPYSHVVSGEEIYYSKTESVDNQIYSYNLETGEDQHRYDHTMTPKVWTETYILGEIAGAFHALDRETAESFYNNLDGAGDLVACEEYDGAVLVLWEDLIYRAESGTEVAWSFEAERTESFFDCLFLKESILVESDDEWILIDAEEGTEQQRGESLPSELSANRLPNVSHDVPLQRFADADAYTENVVVYNDDLSSEVAVRLVETDEEIWARQAIGDSVAIADNTVLVGSPSSATAFDANTGEERWSVETEEQRGSRLIPVGGKLIVNGAVFGW